MDWQIRLEEKIDRISSKIEIINVTLAKQEENIKEHIRRTDIVEANLELLRSEFRPVQKQAIKAEGIIKFISVCAVIITIGVGIIEILTYLK